MPWQSKPVRSSRVTGLASAATLAARARAAASPQGRVDSHGDDQDDGRRNVRPAVVMLSSARPLVSVAITNPPSSGWMGLP